MHVLASMCVLMMQCAQAASHLFVLLLVVIHAPAAPNILLLLLLEHCDNNSDVTGYCRVAATMHLWSIP